MSETNEANVPETATSQSYAQRQRASLVRRRLAELEDLLADESVLPPPPGITVFDQIRYILDRLAFYFAQAYGGDEKAWLESHDGPDGEFCDNPQCVSCDAWRRYEERGRRLTPTLAGAKPDNNIPFLTPEQRTRKIAEMRRRLDVKDAVLNSTTGLAHDLHKEGFAAEERELRRLLTLEAADPKAATYESKTQSGEAETNSADAAPKAGQP